MTDQPNPTRRDPTRKVGRSNVYRYADGYQDALREILDLVDTDGVDAALAYARANQVTR